MRAEYFENHRLVDHGELEVRHRVVDRDARVSASSTMRKATAAKARLG